MDRFTVLLIDPDQLFREAIKRILADADVETVGEARSTEEASGVLGRIGKADLLILDIAAWSMPEVASFLQRARGQGSKIVALTSDHSPGSIRKAIRWSVDAYLSKDMSAEALIRALQLVMAGQQILSTQLTPMLLNLGVAAPTREQGATLQINSLSPREVEILRHLMSGGSNKAIARALDISEATVKVHLKGMLRKIRVSNRTQAAIWATKNGLRAKVA